MNRPSKEERKRMRRSAEAEAAARLSPKEKRKLQKQQRKQMFQDTVRERENQLAKIEYCTHVISEIANRENCSPESIVSEAKKLKVQLSHRMLAGDDAFAVPDHDQDYFVRLKFQTVDAQLLHEADDFEWLTKRTPDSLLGLPCATIKAFVNADPAIDFLHQTVKRVLARLTHGVLISGTQQYVDDDWITWSLDYNDEDMFKNESSLRFVFTQHAVTTKIVFQACAFDP